MFRTVWDILSLSTVHRTVSLSAKRVKSGGLIFQEKCLHCLLFNVLHTLLYTALSCTFLNSTKFCTMYILIYILYSKITKYCKIYYPVHKCTSYWLNWRLFLRKLNSLIYFILNTKQFNVLYIALLLYTLLFTLHRWVLISTHSALVHSI